MVRNVNADLLDASIRHQIGLIRYSTATVRKIIATLNRTDEDIVSQIKEMDPTEVGAAWGEKRLDKLLVSIRRINREAYSLVHKDLRTELVDLAAYEHEYQGNLFEFVTRDLPIRFKTTSPTREQLAAAVNSRPFQGALLREWVDGMEDGRAARLRNAIRIGYTQGESIDDIVRRVRGTRAANYKDGVLEISRRSAEALVRTAVNHTATRAREDVYDQNSDLIKAIRWVSTLDNRTTPICRALDGKTWPLGDPKMRRPPAHIGCRSTTAPVTKSWRELGIDLDEVPPGQRAAMDGKYPEATTYGAWLRAQPVEVQEEIMGVAKAKLFRNGGLDVDRFVDIKTGREYTLEELRRRETEAFKRAGMAAA